MLNWRTYHRQVIAPPRVKRKHCSIISHLHSFPRTVGCEASSKAEGQEQGWCGRSEIWQRLMLCVLDKRRWGLDVCETKSLIPLRERIMLERFPSI